MNQHCLSILAGLASVTVLRAAEMPPSESAVPERPQQTVRILDMHGTIKSARVVEGPAANLPPGPDLVAMAKKALHYLENNPDPKTQYYCRFNIYPLSCPPFQPGAWGPRNVDGIPDPISIGDTESRNDVAFGQMWEMTGLRTGQTAHDAVHRRLVGYIRSGTGKAGDDLCWTKSFCMDGGSVPCIMTWTSGKLLQSSADLFRLTGEKEHQETGRRLVEGLRRLAAWRGDAAYFNSLHLLREDGSFAKAYRGCYPSVITGLISYWQTTKDADALSFAKAMADGFLGDVMPGHLHRPDGRLGGHCHLQMHAVRGVAQLGAVTGEKKYDDWAKAIYDHFWAGAFDTGWLPEGSGHNNHSETCLTADILETTVWLARSGRPEYWDRVDRTVRNYMVPAQFAVTPEIEALWRKVNASRPPEQIEAGLAQLKEFEGGFISALTPNDRVFTGRHHGTSKYDGKDICLDMMGCCPPEGMRAIYLAWANTVTVAPEGMLVNLPLDHNGEQATVESALPGEGRLRVTPKTGQDVFVRPPAWTPRDRVTAWRGGRPVAVTWGGPGEAYVAFPKVAGKESVELRWPLVAFEQVVTLCGGNETYTYQWIGSTVVNVSPAGQYLPLYASGLSSGKDKK